MINTQVRASAGLALLLAASLAGGQAKAQQTVEQAERAAIRQAAADTETRERSAQRADEAQQREEESRAQQQEALQVRLEEAQSKLEEAAREVAELSARLTEDGMFMAIRGLEAIGPRPMLGVNIGTTPETTGPGVHILGVTPDGPADRAGLRSGDVLLAIDDEELIGSDGEERLTAFMKGVEAGQEVKVKYRRDGEEKMITVIPEKMDPMRLFVGGPDGHWEFDFDGLESLEELERLEDLEILNDGHGFHFRAGFPGRWRALELVSLTPDLGEYFGTETGLLVVRSPEGEALGLRDGDVILAIDGREPSNPQHAMRILRSYEPGEAIRFSIVRAREKRTVEIELPAREATGRRWDWRALPMPAPAAVRRPPPPPPIGT